MERNILQLLEHTASRFPDKVAVKDCKEQVTFKQLENNAKLIGSGLCEKFSGCKVIPVYMEKGVKTLEAFLGIVYAGGCYSLIAPILPKERCKSILQKLDAPVLITDGDHLEQVRTFSFRGEVMLIEELLESTLCLEALAAIRMESTSMDPLYVNFTSGSTGNPKGVVVGHGAVIDFIHYFTETFAINSDDIIGNQAPFDFDVSVKDIYSMLYTGATLYIIPRTSISFAKKVLEELERENVTTLIWAVSALCLITSLNGFSYIVPRSLKKVMFSGEVMPMKHLLAWKEALPDAMFVNLYGPTEITCNCTYYVVPQKIEEGDLLPIGKAFPNEKVLLIGGNDELITQAGREGEICVGGAELALGYFGDEEKTAQVFLQNPFNTEYRELLYHTGDIAYYAEDGNLIYVGRKDFQIKHMGHRIELGEIEGNILKNPKVVRVCCLYDETKQQIVAFYQGEVDKKEIKEGLKDSLIKYMIPERYVKLDQLPLNENGKIDRHKLKADYIF